MESRKRREEFFYFLKILEHLEFLKIHLLHLQFTNCNLLYHYIFLTAKIQIPFDWFQILVLMSTEYWVKKTIAGLYSWMKLSIKVKNLTPTLIIRKRASIYKNIYINIYKLLFKYIAVALILQYTYIVILVVTGCLKLLRLCWKIQSI